MRQKFSGKEFENFVSTFDKVYEAMIRYKVKVLYGFKWQNGGGVFVNILANKVFSTKFDYIIDDEEISYGIDIYKRNLLDYLDSSNTVIINTTGEKNCYEQLGYATGINWIDIPTVFDLPVFGYLEYIEKKYNLEISSRTTTKNIHSISEDGVKYGPSRSMSLPFLLQYLVDNYNQSKVLDLGCGKGGAMIAFKDFGYKDVDGIEIDPELAEIAKENLKKFSDEKSDVINKDVLEFNNYESYDLFYLYDSFHGDTFSKTIELLKKSVESSPRKIVLVYANPYEHRKIVENGYFKLKKQFVGDWLYKFVNIYEN